MCENCEDTNFIFGYDLGDDNGAIDIQLDPENATLDVIYLALDLDCGIEINFCPFCGRRLHEETERK